MSVKPIATLLVVVVVLLTGCAASAVISDLEEDKVIVQATGNDMSFIDSKAREGCGFHGRYPVPVSFRCVDGYCIQKAYLIPAMCRR